jgi:hypothetical protein
MSNTALKTALMLTILVVNHFDRLIQYFFGCQVLLILK